MIVKQFVKGYDSNIHRGKKGKTKSEESNFKQNVFISAIGHFEVTKYLDCLTTITLG